MQYALDRPDGTRVSLAMVVVGAVNSSGVSVHEWWDKTTPIAAIFDPPPSLRAGQTIDLEGWMTTLPGGRRAVLCERIAFYLDSRGSVTSALPPMKGILDPSVWPAKGWIPVYSPRSSIQSLSTDGGRSVLTEEIEPPIGGGDPPIAGSMSLADHSIAKAKSLADAALLTSAYTLTNKIVTAGNGQFSGFIYIEEPDRSCGIRVTVSSGTYAPGDDVTVSAGTLGTTTDGERYIYNATITKNSTSDQLAPLGSTNRDIGGNDLMYEQTLLQQGVTNGSGLNNIGLLVKTWGKITYAAPSGEFIYIDDGSGAADGFTYTDSSNNVVPAQGVRVAAIDLAAGNAVTLPANVGSIVHVAGISSCTTITVDNEALTARMIRVRSQEDVSSAVIYVKTPVNGGDDSNDGLSWDTAKETVQEALDTARAGMEVWVAAGTYYEHNITLKDSVGLYGGFSANGGEAYREQRNWHDNVAVLDAGGGGSVVNCPSGATASTVIDGFTIQNGSAANGGGIYCYGGSPAIAHNRIIGNQITGEAGNGGGVYCRNSSGCIVGNVIADNHLPGGSGAGIYCDSSPSMRIVNNTITGNTYGGGSGGGIHTTGSSPVLIANNIIAGNTSGVSWGYSAPTLLNNCVSGNTAYDYSDTEVDRSDIADTPMIDTEGHLQQGSPCIDAGDDSVVLFGSLDIDAEARVQRTHVDIGADEYTDPCTWYRVALDADSVFRQMGQAVTITVTVTDPNTGRPVQGRRVDLALTEGQLTNIWNDNLVSWSPDTPPTTGYGLTGIQGKVHAQVTRGTAGWVTVTAEVANTCTTGETTESMNIRFYDPAVPVDLLFLMDVTGSTSLGAVMKEHITQTVSYLHDQLQAQGRTLRVAGIKYSSAYQPGGLDVCGNRAVFRDFTDAATFNTWVLNQNPPYDGGEEYTLDILMCAKDKSPTAYPGLYIALATDEDSDIITGVTPSISEVATALTQAGAIVFIDPGVEIDPNPPITELLKYYPPLAVNGGCVEQDSVGTFTFPSMREMILTVLP